VPSQDFPKKVWLAKDLQAGPSSGFFLAMGAEELAVHERASNRAVQSYVPTDCLEELVEALQEIHGATQEAAHELDDPLDACESIRRTTEAALTRARSILGVEE